MSNNDVIGIFAELARDFEDRFGVKPETAKHMIGIFAATAASGDEAQAEAEFTKAAQVGLQNGEEWAKDYVDSFIRTQFSQAPAIIAESRNRGTDPAVALAAVYGLPAEAAQGLVDLLQARGGL